MYRVHQACTVCGRRFSYDSDKPIECPFTADHGKEEPTGKERVERYKTLKQELRRPPALSAAERKRRAEVRETGLP